MQSLLIDSNILIYHLKGEEKVRRALSQWSHEKNRLFISAITRIEVLAAPVLQEGEEAGIEELLSEFTLINVDIQIADVAARIRRLYRLKLGDSIIGATTLLLNASIVTRNVRDFKKVPSLEIIRL